MGGMRRRPRGCGFGRGGERLAAREAVVDGQPGRPGFSDNSGSETGELGISASMRGRKPKVPSAATSDFIAATVKQAAGNRSGKSAALGGFRVGQPGWPICASAGYNGNLHKGEQKLEFSAVREFFYELEQVHVRGMDCRGLRLELQLHWLAWRLPLLCPPRRAGIATQTALNVQTHDPSGRTQATAAITVDRS